ncbi:hypothetical protein GGR52DRAFT_572621 [Hypoxylon sp. FL1284]|nr:hypothetical protein GGR52DRAFT_572621 [Hypoxylon sp. FL1284]
MQFSSIILALAATATASVMPRDGPRLAQLRVFGDAGCKEQNYGFYTVDKSESNQCRSFTDVPTAVKSVNLEQMNYPAANGCSLYLYTSSDCTSGRRAIPVGACQELQPDDKEFASFQVFCPTGAIPSA